MISLILISSGFSVHLLLILFISCLLWVLLVALLSSGKALILLVPVSSKIPIQVLLSSFPPTMEQDGSLLIFMHLVLRMEKDNLFIGSSISTCQMTLIG